MITLFEYQQYMQQSEQGLSSDFLRLETEPKFKCLLESKENVLFSTSIFKYNSEGKCQQRILVVTNTSVLNILKSENIIKTFIKKFINFQNKYEIKRRILLSNIYGITLTPDRNCNMFLIHVSNEHDYHYQAQNNKMTILKAIVDQYKQVTKNPLPFYFRDQGQLSNYFTTKSHLKEKKDIRPKDNPIYLSDDYFLERSFEEDYICEYSHMQKKVEPKQFKIIQGKDTKKGESYFILKEQFNRAIHVNNLYQSPIVINPHYTFYSEKKQLLFIPFMPGGNIKQFLAKQIPLKPDDLIFYLTQIILFLAELHSHAKVYSNLVLENILVKQNGYLVLSGLEKSIQNCPEGKILGKVKGNAYYFPPQVIQCRGYREQIDIWKLGICAYFLVKGALPFTGKNLKELYFNILNSSIEDQEDVPPFIKRMLQKDKNKRITISQLLELGSFSKERVQLIKKEAQNPPFMPNIQNCHTLVPNLYRLNSQS